MDVKTDRRRDRSEAIVQATFSRLDTVAISCALGVLGAVVLWLATAILLLRGAPPGVEIGPHLSLLGQFLPLYAVSWSGSIVGLVYGFVIGYVIGMLVGLVWNVSHVLYLRTLVGPIGSSREL